MSAGRASEVLGETWSFTELSDWTHASPAQVNSDVIWPWFTALPSLPEPPELLAVLQTLAPEIFEEEE